MRLLAVSNVNGKFDLQSVNIFISRSGSGGSISIVR